MSAIPKSLSIHYICTETHMQWDIFTGNALHFKAESNSAPAEGPAELYLVSTHLLVIFKYS